MTKTEKMLIEELIYYKYMFATAVDHLENSGYCFQSVDDVIFSAQRCEQFDNCYDCWHDYIVEDAKQHCHIRCDGDEG